MVYTSVSRFLPFSIVCDDTIYTMAGGNNTGHSLFASNAWTQEGETWKSLLSPLQIYVPMVVYNDQYVDKVPYLRFTDLFPLTSCASIPGMPTRYADRQDFVFDTPSPTLKIGTGNAYVSASLGNGNPYFLVNDVQIRISNSMQTPIGFFTADDTTARYNYFNFTLLVGKEDRTSFKQLRFYAGNTSVSCHTYVLGQTDLDNVNTVLNNLSTSPWDTDPYYPGGNTHHGGGGGSFDDNSDPQTFPPAPTKSVSNVNFIRLWNPTDSELLAISSYLWSNDFNVENFKKLFANPMDCILGLSVVPVTVSSGTPVQFTIGNVTANNVLVRPVTNQYVIKNFGTLDVEEFFASYLDYSPYTKIELYLPYIGIEEISPDDVMGKTIELQYNIDCLTGACVAMLKCDDSILYQFAGNCAMSLPIAGRDMLSVISGALGVISKGVTAIGGIATGEASGVAQAVGAMSSAVTDAMKAKRNVQKSGTITGVAGFMGVQTPYLIITRPRQALPEMQNTYTGYPSFMTMLLGDCSGFTTVTSVHLENIPATSMELTEIENLLATGVLF